MPVTSKGRFIRMPTPEEDAIITAAALSDPDAQPLTEDQLKAMIPMRDVPARLRELRGRPLSENKKLLVSVRFSPEVISFFKSAGEGWQSRMDGVLREYVASQSSKS